MSDIASLISDLIAANTPPELVGRVCEALAGGKATKTARRSIAYTDDFEAFWKAYPTDQNMSKLEAWQQWQKIDATERELAMKAVEPFKAWIKTQKDYRPIHACRFLSKKRFEGHAAQPDLKVVSSNPGKHILKDSPEWLEYAEAYRAEHGKYPPVDKRGGWFFKEASRG